MYGYRLINNNFSLFAVHCRSLMNMTIQCLRRPPKAGVTGSNPVGRANFTW